MLTQLVNAIVIISMISKVVNCYSACDDIDIHFILDTDSIINNGENIKKFIRSVVWNGTSEYSAISISIYGKHVPFDMQSAIIITLNETHSIYKREQQEGKIISQLERTFVDITSSMSSRTDRTGITITLSDAFKHSNDQYKPVRISKKDSVFSQISSESVKMDEYFVFDHYNKLLKKSNPENLNNDELCDIMYNDRVVNKNIHFIMGQSYTKQSLRVKCGNGNLFYDRVNANTFHSLPDILADESHKKFENIYDITCPTNIDINNDKINGDLSLSNHVQWIDSKVIEKCELVDIENDDITASFEIDEKKSFIQIKNNYNFDKYDDNTFKINDYLLIHKNDISLLTEKGCWSHVYKIKNIKIIMDNNNNESSLKLFVSLPKSPQEYIMRANVKGNQALFSTNTEQKQRRLFTTLITDLTSKELSSNSTSGSISYSKTDGTLAEYVINDPIEIIFEGIGTINTSLIYSFYIDVDLDFEFNWDVLGDDVYMYYTLNSDYNFFIDFNLEFEGIIQVLINDLIKFGRYYFFFLGPVPVVIKPFIDIDLKLTTLPIEVDAELICNYGSYDKYGYEYDYQSNYSPVYDIIKENTKYSLTVIKTWTDISSIDECAALNYEYDNKGAACNYFDYNPTTKICRCAGATFSASTTTDSGTTAYKLDATCDDAYTVDCGYTSSCDFGDTIISASTDGCSTGQGKYECISCSDDEGVSSETTNEESIKTQTPNEYNGCSYNYTVESNGYDLSECPRSDSNDLFGFDTQVNITIGANLYTIIIVYGKGVLDIPFRINIPEFNDNICNDVSESCTDSQVMKASFDIAMDLAFYIGVDVDFSQLLNIVQGMVGETSGIEINGLDFQGTEFETLIGEYTILDKTNLGCLSFDGILSFLNTYYKGICCETDENGDSVPVYIDTDDNGYDDRYEPTFAPTADPGVNDGNSAKRYHGLGSFAAIIIGLIFVSIN